MLRHVPIPSTSVGGISIDATTKGKTRMSKRLEVMVTYTNGVATVSAHEPTQQPSGNNNPAGKASTSQRSRYQTLPSHRDPRKNYR